jgi:hypothetical protein
MTLIIKGLLESLIIKGLLEALSIKSLLVTLSIKTLWIECHYAERRKLFRYTVSMLNVVAPKSTPGTNTLAYFPCPSVTNKKVFIVLTHLEFLDGTADNLLLI